MPSHFFHGGKLKTEEVYKMENWTVKKKFITAATKYRKKNV